MKWPVGTMSCTNQRWGRGSRDRLRTNQRPGYLEREGGAAAEGGLEAGPGGGAACTVAVIISIGSVFSVQGNLCSGEMSIREISIRYMSAVKNVAKSRMIKLLVGCLMNWKLRPAAMLLWW